MDKQTYYDRLGLPQDATPNEIRHAYRDMARRLHPDTSPGPGVTELFIGVQQAYEVLIDPKQKKDYDSTLPAEAGIAPPVVSSVIYSRNTLVRMAEPQLLYALLEFSSKPIDNSLTKPPMNICLVLDCSTSMQGIRLETVKWTAIELIQQLQVQDIISIIKFSDKAEVVIPARRNFSPGDIKNKIHRLSTSGGTEIYPGLLAGYNEVLRNREKSRVNHIILITDGRTYGDEDKCLRLADQAAFHGIGISTLGIGGQWNDSFLDTIASHTGGSSIYVSNPENLKRFLLDKVSKLGENFSEQISYTFQTPPGVELNYAFRIHPEISPLVNSSPIVMGNVPLDAKLRVILEFIIHEIPVDSESLMLTKGFLNYDVLLQSEWRKITDRLELWRPFSQELDSTPPPPEIIQAMSNLTLYRMQESARRDLLEGKEADATRRLQNLADHLLAQGQNELARSVLSEIVHIQRTHKFSEEGEKRIKYGTRSLLLPPGSEFSP